MQHISSNLATAIRTVVILVFCLGGRLSNQTRIDFSDCDPYRVFLILSGQATGLSWLCYFRALQIGEASRIAPVDKLSVVIAIALAAIVLHEHLTWHQWGLLIFAGAVVIAAA